MKNTQSPVTTEIKFSIEHNISTSKGWGRYKVTTDDAVPLVRSSTGNEWVSAPHVGQANDGAVVVATLQTMERVGKRCEERIDTYTYRLIVASGERAEIGHWNGLQVIVEGARLA